MNIHQVLNEWSTLRRKPIRVETKNYILRYNGESYVAVQPLESKSKYVIYPVESVPEEVTSELSFARFDI